MKAYRQKLEVVQRKMAIRICTVYRTVSLEAAQVVSGSIPIDLRVAERERIHMDLETTKDTVRERIVHRWDDLGGRAAWTRRLIPVLAPWLGRRHGEVHYHLAQFLTDVSGHV